MRVLRKRFILAFVLLLSTASIVQAKKEKKPNIVLIFADDMTYESLGCTSNGEVMTPNLDRLRSEGTYFSHAYNQGGYNGAISMASRAMMNTGKYLWTAMDEVQGHLDSSHQNWPAGVAPYVPVKPTGPITLWSQYMKEAGYETYMTGKWHVPIAAKGVFDHVRHVRPGMPNQSKEGYERKFIKGVTDVWTPTDTIYGGYWKGGKHWSEVLKDDALDYIDDAEHQKKPFFMYLAFNAPHDPRQAPQEYQDMYPLDKVKVPDTFMPLYPYCEEMGAGRSLRDERLAPFPRTRRSVKVNRKEYYALITHLDAQIGQILDSLEQSGEMDNTYIFFTADHGLAVGDHGFIGKQNLYEASIRVPLIMVGPGIMKNKQVDGMVYLHDVMATALDLAGSEGVNKVDFQSLLDLAEGKTTKTRKAIINCYIGCQRMIRTEEYKMIIYPNANMVRLFNEVSDPLEMHDLAQNPENIPLMKDLFEQFKILQQEVRDPLDMTPYFNYFINTLN